MRNRILKCENSGSKDLNNVVNRWKEYFSYNMAAEASRGSYTVDSDAKVDWNIEFKRINI